MFGKKTKTSAKRPSIEKNPAESFAELPTSLAKSLTNDFGKEAVSDMWTQLLGGSREKHAPSHPTSGDLAEGQEINFSNMSSHQETASRQEVDPEFDYRQEILHGEKRIAHKETQELQVQIQEIIIELRQLMGSSQELQTKFKHVAADQRITTPGKYHVSFFKWVISAIREARIQIEDSAAWLSAFQGKKAKRDYWTRSKNEGTTFSQNNERAVATQTG